MLYYHDFQDIFKFMLIEQLKAFEQLEIQYIQRSKVIISYDQLFRIKASRGQLFLRQQLKLVKNIQQTNNIETIFPSCYFFKSQKEFQHIQQQQRIKLKLSHQLRQMNESNIRQQELLQKVFFYNSYTKQEYFESAERPLVQKLLKYNVNVKRAFNSVQNEIVSKDYLQQLNIISEPIIFCFSEQVQKVILIDPKGNLLQIDKNIIQQRLSLKKQKTSLILFWSVVIFLSQNDQQSIFQDTLSTTNENFEIEYLKRLKMQSIKLVTLILTLNQIENLNLNQKNLYAFSKTFKTRYELMNKNFQIFSQQFNSCQKMKLQEIKLYQTIQLKSVELNHNFCSQKGIIYANNFLIPKQYSFLMNQKSKKIIFNDRYFINQSRELFHYQKKQQKKQKAILDNIKENLFVKIPQTIVLKQYYNDHIFQNVNSNVKKKTFVYFNDCKSNMYQSVIEQIIEKSYKTTQDHPVSMYQLLKMSIYMFLQRNKFFNNKTFGQNFKANFLLYMIQKNFVQESLLFLEFLDLGYLDRKVFLSAQDDFAHCNHKFFKHKKDIFTNEDYYQYISDLMNEDLLFLYTQVNDPKIQNGKLDMIWKAQIQNYLQSKTFFQQNHQQILSQIFTKYSCNQKCQNPVLWETLTITVFQNIDNLYILNLMGSFQEFNGSALFSEEVRTLRLFSFIEEIKNITNSYIQSTLTNLIIQHKLDPLQFQKQIFQSLPFKKLLLPKTLSLFNEFLILVLIYPVCESNMIGSTYEILQKLDLLKKALTQQGSFLLTRTFRKTRLWQRQTQGQNSIASNKFFKTWQLNL